MEEQIRLNVLWVDDMPTEDFMNEAYKNGLYITSAMSVKTGMAILNDKSKLWDAIILDANCKITDDEQEQPSLKALKEAIAQLVHMRTDIPWFVYTGGDYEEVEHLEYMIKERNYDDRLYYEKPKQRYDLFENIKKAASNKELLVLKRKYQREFKAAGTIEGATQLLKDGLTYNYNDDWGNVQDYFNPARKILERIFDKLKKQKILPPINSLNAISKLLSNNKYEDDGCCYEIKKEIMPVVLAHSLKYFLDITQDGSHSSGDLKLGIDSYIRESHNANLFHSILFIAMDLLLWYMDVLENINPTEEIWVGSMKYEYTGTLCLSPDGKYWYTGEYELFGDSSFVDGTRIAIKKSIGNKKSRIGIKRFVPKGCYVLLGNDQ